MSKSTEPAGAWLGATRQSWTAFIVQSGSEMFLPFDVRLTGIGGEVLIAADVVTGLGDGSQFDVGPQLEPCALFAADFESGDTGAWTTTAP